MIIRGRNVRPAVLVAGAFVGLVCAVALVAETVLHTSIDPTGQAFAVTLHNDTVDTVVLKQCDSTCDVFHESDRLPPGASVLVNTSSDDAANWWAVTDASGSVMGCLPLTHTHRIEGLVIDVSTYTRCPT